MPFVQMMRRFKSSLGWPLFFILVACSTKPIVVSEHEVSTPASPVEINAKPEIDEPETPTCKPSELGPRYFLELQLSPLDPRQAALKRSTSIRLPGDAKPADHWLGGGLPERCDKHDNVSQCPPMRIDLLDYQPARFTICGSENTIIKELQHVFFSSLSYPMKDPGSGATLNGILATCGVGYAVPRSFGLEDRLTHRLTPDLSECEIEVNANDMTDNRFGGNHHYLGFMRGRITSEELFEWQVVVLAVREDQWTDEVADIIRASARSFEVDWDAVDARKKLDLLIDSERTHKIVRKTKKQR